VSTVVADVSGSAPEQAPPRERVRRRRLTSFILPVFTGGMILYLASPVFLMILYGFNELRGERQSAVFNCCTLTWWRQLTNIPELNESLLRSIEVAIPAALIATVLGAMIGLVLGRYSFSGRPALNFVIFLAIAIPEIVLGSALLSMFVQVNEWRPAGFTFSLGYQTILISHIGFAVAFVAITVRARVQGLDR